MWCRQTLVVFPLAWCAACSAPRETAANEAFTDRLMQGVAAARVTPDGGVFAVSEGGEISLADPVLDEVVSLGEAASILGTGRLSDGTVLLAAGGVAPGTEPLLAWSGGEASPSELAAAIPGELLELSVRDGAVWMRSTSGLYMWEDGGLSTVSVRDSAAPGPSAAGGLVDGRPVVWASGGFGLAAVAVDGVPDILASRGGQVLDVATDARGQAWAVMADGVWTWGDSGWARVDVPAVEVAAGPEAEGAWASGASLWRLEADGAAAVAAPALTGLQVTPLGVAGVAEGELLHVALERGALASLPAEGAVLEEATPVVVWATDAAAVTDVLLSVGAEEVVMEPLAAVQGWRAVLEPAALPPSSDLSLAVQTSWEGGEQHEAGSSTVAVAASGPITWDDHIGPLYAGRCAHCHDNGTETVLTGPESWQARLDDILTEVSLGRMPIGGESLTEGEIAMIEEWADGGFP